jgi:phage shock protein PspC (stress-responsive transcriptional regulator)
LVTTRQRVVAGQPGGAAEAFQVRIPALNLIFVGNFVNGMLTLTSIMDVPMYGITANSPSDARELLAKLKPMAQQHNGLPR